MAKEWIGENTGEWLLWMPRKVFKLWLKDTDGFWSFNRQYTDSGKVIKALQIVNQLFYMVIILLAFASLFIVTRAVIQKDEPKSRMGLLFCMPIFVSLLAAVFTGQIRYHHAAMPYLIVLACYASLKLLPSDNTKMLALQEET